MGRLDRAVGYNSEIEDWLTQSAQIKEAAATRTAKQRTGNTGAQTPTDASAAGGQTAPAQPSPSDGGAQMSGATDAAAAA
eukprot:3261277-Pyramimonas_sp.AAC.1